MRSAFGVLCAFALCGLPGVARDGAFAEAEAPDPPSANPAPGKAAQPPPLADESGRYDPARVWLGESSAEQRMLQAIAAGDLAQARALGEAALASADEASRDRLAWLLARAEESPEQAAARLASVRASNHPLARWAALRQAESLLLQKPSDVPPIASGLTKGWPGARDARVLLARAYHLSGRDADAEPLLKALVEQSSPRSPAATVSLPLADILATRGTDDGLRDSLVLYRRVGARGAGKDQGDQADKLAKRVLGRMNAKDRARFAQPTEEDEFARGDALMSGHRYAEAQKVFDKLATRLKRDPAARCKAELEAGHALFNRRERAQAAKRLDAVAKRCKDPDVKAWARYYAGSARQRTNDPKGAIAEYEALVREVPDHSLADDVLFLEAAAQEDAGDSKAARAVLERLIARYPRGDMHDEARFALSFAARARGDLLGALEQLERMLQDDVKERGEGLEGRSAYWRARTLQDLGRREEAKAGYLELARALPFSYHAQQAIARIAELDAPAKDALLAELAASGPNEPLRFAWRPELDSAGFRTAVELLRVGEIDLAKRELAALGLLGDATDSETLWLVAATLDAAHAYSDASQLVRGRLSSFRSSVPRGPARQRWRIAYPLAFRPLIESAAAEVQLPPELVWAIAREESDFNPDAVSSALAYGLVQLIVPTARIHAKTLGLPSDPQSLKRPDINLRIGAHFMQELWQRYSSNPAVLPAAYNAGYLATDRWLREAHEERLDEWIERIPYRETRRYTRRVLQSYGVYSWLETGKLPPLLSTLPPAPLPQSGASAPTSQASDAPTLSITATE